jgi:hypothetical protein
MTVGGMSLISWTRVELCKPAVFQAAFDCSRFRPPQPKSGQLLLF